MDPIVTLTLEPVSDPSQRQPGPVQTAGGLRQDRPTRLPTSAANPAATAAAAVPAAHSDAAQPSACHL